jgi:probable HAF family extracellular repeat protein
MRAKAIVFSSVVISLFLNTSAIAYRQIIDLGPGTAYSINDNGQVVGKSGDHAFLYKSSDGSKIDLGTLGDSQSVAYSINNAGRIVGQADGWACLFDSTGGGTNNLLGGTGFGGIAYSINNSDRIVGASGNGHACFFSLFRDLGTLNLDMTSTAYSINDNGRVVGISRLTNTSGTGGRACLFDPSGQGDNTYLGGLGGFGSEAYSININDLIVGEAALYRDPLSTDPLISHACIFDSTGGRNNTDLGTLGGGGSCAEFVNSNDQIVGYAYDIIGGPPSSPYIHSNFRACLFDPTGQENNIDLNTLIDPHSGWILKGARCINNSGWIVGSMINTNDETHAFLLTPEPATLLIFGLGAALLRKRK